MSTFEPTPALLAKLGSIAIHADEFLETGEQFDKVAIESLLSDPDVRDWLEDMDNMSLLPKKRG